MFRPSFYNTSHFDSVNLKKFEHLNIAIDFDDTFSTDPQMFKEIIKIFRSRGHNVYLVTYRCGDINHVSNLDIFAYQSNFDGIFFTQYESKKDFMDKQKIKIHIWIDDNPYSIIDSMSCTTSLH